MIETKTFPLSPGESMDCLRRGKRFYCSMLDNEGHTKQELSNSIGPFNYVQFTPVHSFKKGNGKCECNGVEVMLSTADRLRSTFNGTVDCTAIRDKVGRKSNNSLTCMTPSD